MFKVLYYALVAYCAIGSAFFLYKLAAGFMKDAEKLPRLNLAQHFKRGTGESVS